MKFCHVGAAGIMLGEKDSAGVLKAMETIQKSGNSVMAARTAETAIQTNCTSLACEGAKKWGLGMFEAPAPREEEEDGRHEHEGRHEDRGHCRRVAERAEAEGLLIDVDNQYRGGVGRAALGHHVDDVEGLRAGHRRHHGDHEHEEARGFEQGQRDVPETLYWPGAVDLGRL